MVFVITLTGVLVGSVAVIAVVHAKRCRASCCYIQRQRTLWCDRCSSSLRGYSSATAIPTSPRLWLTVTFPPIAPPFNRRRVGVILIGIQHFLHIPETAGRIAIPCQTHVGSQTRKVFTVTDTYRLPALFSLSCLVDQAWMISVETAPSSPRFSPYPTPPTGICC